MFQTICCIVALAFAGAYDDDADCVAKGQAVLRAKKQAGAALLALAVSHATKAA